jgi:hypothetical protein
LPGGRLPLILEKDHEQGAIRCSRHSGRPALLKSFPPFFHFAIEFTVDKLFIAAFGPALLLQQSQFAQGFSG